MGKTTDLFKEIRDTKGTIHAKMGSIKDRNGMDLAAAGDTKKRWQGYTELHKKALNDLDNHGGVITHLEPDILECEVKWALGSTAAAKSLQSCPTLCDPIDSSPLGSSVPGILQARILEWVAITVFLKN